jgi:hypothetical protein
VLGRERQFPRDAYDIHINPVSAQEMTCGEHRSTRMYGTIGAHEDLHYADLSAASCEARITFATRWSLTGLNRSYDEAKVAAPSAISTIVTVASARYRTFSMAAADAAWYRNDNSLWLQTADFFNCKGHRQTGEHSVIHDDCGSTVHWRCIVTIDLAKPPCLLFLFPNCQSEPRGIDGIRGGGISQRTPPF